LVLDGSGEGDRAGREREQIAVDLSTVDFQVRVRVLRETSDLQALKKLLARGCLGSERVEECSAAGPGEPVANAGLVRVTTKQVDRERGSGDHCRHLIVPRTEVALELEHRTVRIAADLAGPAAQLFRAPAEPDR